MEKTEEVKVIKIVPERDKLSAEVRKNIPCPIDGCGKVLAQSAALRLHLVLTHKIVQVKTFSEYFDYRSICHPMYV